MAREKAVVLLSGGMDSATVLAYAVSRGFRAYAISFRYGQRHSAEIGCARKIGRLFNVVEHQIVKFEMSRIGVSALTSKTARIPEREFHGIPPTYVPARNMIFLSFASAWAESIGARDIFIGVNSVDYSGYPDCRPEFIRAFEKTANLGTKAATGKWSFKIRAPLQNLCKSEIIRLGNRLGVDFRHTLSCYNPAHGGVSCGKCNSCTLRLKGFREAGIRDPIRYSRN